MGSALRPWQGPRPRSTSSPPRVARPVQAPLSGPGCRPALLLRRRRPPAHPCQADAAAGAAVAAPRPPLRWRRAADPLRDGGVVQQDEARPARRLHPCGRVHGVPLVPPRVSAREVIRPDAPPRPARNRAAGKALRRGSDIRSLRPHPADTCAARTALSRYPGLPAICDDRCANPLKCFGHTMPPTLAKSQKLKMHKSVIKKYFFQNFTKYQ